MGLVLKCYDNYDEMMMSAKEIARAIAAKSPITIRYVVWRIKFCEKI